MVFREGRILKKIYFIPSPEQRHAIRLYFMCVAQVAVLKYHHASYEISTGTVFIRE